MGTMTAEVTDLRHDVEAAVMKGRARKGPQSLKHDLVVTAFAHRAERITGPADECLKPWHRATRREWSVWELARWTCLAPGRSRTQGSCRQPWN